MYATSPTGSERREGGRFDFNDGGSFVGEWSDGRAHGLGVATGPDDNPGEYSGEWMLGFECLGVYIWPSGSKYEGRWAKGKRHGEGVQTQGHWRYRGEFTTGFYGRYGIRESLNSGAKYEGSWNLNQFDGFGVETNADGSTYAGGWTKGVRSGLGVRRSVPYGLAADFHSGENAPRATMSSRGNLTSQSDLTSNNMSLENISRHRRLDEHKNGFVLTGWSTHHGGAHGQQMGGGSGVSHSKKSLLEKSSSLLQMGFLKKLRKQKSTGDLNQNALSFRSGRGGGSLRSTTSNISQATNYSAMSLQPPHSAGSAQLQLPGSPMSIASSSTYSPSVASGGLLEMIVDPSVTETYHGQWLDDKRMGYGVAERSDGLRYEGEWLNNKKNGYGCTYFPDGSKEEGRYRNNVLVSALNRKAKLLLLRGSRTRECVDAAITKAQHMAREALVKAQESAHQRANTARMAAVSAEKAAAEAKRASMEARAVSYELAPEFVQPGPSWCPSAVSDLPPGTFRRTVQPQQQSGNSSSGAGNNLQPPVGGSRGLQRGVRSQSQPRSISKRLPDTPEVEERSGASQLESPAPGECLEISGGSRQGSFRSRKPRGGKNSQDNDGSQKQQQQHIPTRMEPPIVSVTAAQTNFPLNQQFSRPNFPSGSDKDEKESMNQVTETISPQQAKQQMQQQPPRYPETKSQSVDRSAKAPQHVPVSEIDDHFDYYWSPDAASHYFSEMDGDDYGLDAGNKRDSGVGGETSGYDDGGNFLYSTPPGIQQDQPSMKDNQQQSADHASRRIARRMQAQHRGDSSDTHDSGMSDISQISRDSRTTRRQHIPTRQPPANTAPSTSRSNARGLGPPSASASSSSNQTNGDLLRGLGIDHPGDIDRSKIIIENGIRKRVLEESAHQRPTNSRRYQPETPSSSGGNPARVHNRRLSEESPYPREPPPYPSNRPGHPTVTTNQQKPTTEGSVISFSVGTEWLRENIWVILVLALNVVLVVAFLSIMKDKSKSPPSPARPS